MQIATKTTLPFHHKHLKQEKQLGISQDNGKQIRMNISAPCPRAILSNTEIYKKKKLK